MRESEKIYCATSNDIVNVLNPSRTSSSIMYREYLSVRNGRDALASIVVNTVLHLSEQSHRTWIMQPTLEKSDR